MVSKRDNGNWNRRGWLVMLRARHLRRATVRTSSRWQWTTCCRKRVGHDVLKKVRPLPGGGIDMESGLEEVAYDAAVSECRQLLMWVVESEEERIFHSIVRYL